MSDDFNDNTRDTTKWSVGLFSKDSSQFDPQVQVLEQSGQLQIKPLANTLGNHYNGFVSVRRWDMTGAQASVEVVQTTGGPGMSFVFQSRLTIELMIGAPANTSGAT